MQKTFLQSNARRALFVIAALTFAFILGPTPKGDALALTKRERNQIQDPTSANIPELKLGIRTERQLTAAEPHSYRVTLATGQFVKVIALQKSIDIVLAIFAPSGQKLSEVDNTGGPERVFVVAESSGDYRVDVRTVDKEAKPGTYEIGIEEPREATARDRVAVAAEKLFEEGNQLRDKRTAESRRKAITKYEEALPLWREAIDPTGEAQTLNELGVVHANLGEPKKGVEYFLRALPLARSSGNQVLEATTLTSMGTTYWISGEPQKALESHNQALPLARAAGATQTEGAILGNIGSVYWSLGQPETALEYYHQALAIARARGDRRRQAITAQSRR